MKKIISLVLFAAITSFSFAQNEKNVVHDANAEIRKVGDFTGIDVSNAIAVYISQGNENAVAISADGERTDRIKTEVKNGVLKIYVEGKDSWNWNNKRMKAYVTIKTLNKLTVSGASSASITDKINSTDLRVNLSGASSLKGALQVSGVLKVDASGASTANISGSANEFDVDASGASNVKAFDLEATTCSAEASGASSVKINVVKEFSKLEASGASSIRYKGDATVRNFEASGASSIKKETSSTKKES
jgi:hypothetical protein